MSEITDLPLDPVPATKPTQSTVFRTMVRMDRPPVERKIILSVIDQIAPRCYIYGLLAFRTPRNPPKAEIFRCFVQGLRQALNEFPEIAGRVIPVETPRDGLAIEIDNHGVLFQMLDATLPENAAVWPYGSFKDLEKKNFSINSLPPEVFCPGETDNNEAGTRCSYGQITFVEGGFFMSHSFHHVATDGPGASQFLMAWARHTRIAAQSEIIPSKTKPAAIFRRHPIDSTGIEDVHLNEFPHWKVANAGPLLEGTTRTVGLTGTHISDLDLRAKRPVVSMWHVSVESLKKLRATIGGERGRIGQNEALCALIWRHVSRARLLQNSNYKESVLSTPVDCRRAMKLHPEYAGNACEPNAYSRMPISKICATDYDSLYELAQEIRSQVAQVDSVAVRRLVGLLKTMPSATHLTWNCDRWPGPDMLISSLLEAGWTYHDWGMNIGRSEAGRFLMDPEGPVDGRVFILPRSKDARGVEMIIRYPQDILDRLARDTEWTKFCEVWEC